MLIIVLLMAIICVRRRQLAVLATGGADQIQPQPAGCPHDDAKSLPPVVDVGWTTTGDLHRRGSGNCDPQFQIVRNVVTDSHPWDCGSAPWKSATLQSPSRMMCAAERSEGDDDDGTAELCHVYVSTPPNNTTGRLHRTPPQLQTFSVSLARLTIVV